MRRVLIIAYYWPPSGGGGVQRWLKFTKYLPEFGWQPVVYVPFNPQYPLRDDSLIAEVADHVQVIKGHIWEPRRLYRRLKKLRHGSKWSAAPEMDTIFFRDPASLPWFGRLSLFLRSNMFVPDSRSPWIKPSVRRLKKWLTRNPVDVIVSTGPPHSCHLIGMALHQATRIPWVADFRDPWTDIDYFPKLLLTQRTRRKHESLQRAVLQTATRTVTVSPSWAKLFEGYGAKAVDVITNGFDPVDLQQLDHHGPADESKIRIACIGTLEVDRTPSALWKSLEKLSEDNPDLHGRIEIHLAGKIDPLILPESPQARSRIFLHGYLSHKEALNLMARAEVLLLILNTGTDANTRGRIPGKLFEYLALNKPILLIGSTSSDTAEIVSKVRQSWVLEPDDVAGTFRLLSSLGFSDTARSEKFEIHGYERRHLAGRMASLLSDICN